MITMFHQKRWFTGLTETASILQQEADLTTVTTSPVTHPTTPLLYSTPSTNKSMVSFLVFGTEACLWAVINCVHHFPIFSRKFHKKTSVPSMTQQVKMTQDLVFSILVIIIPRLIYDLHCVMYKLASCGECLNCVEPNGIKGTRWFDVLHDGVAVSLFSLQCFQHTPSLPSSSIPSTSTTADGHSAASSQAPAPPGTPLKVNLISSKVHSQAFTNQTRVCYQCTPCALWTIVNCRWSWWHDTFR